MVRGLLCAVGAALIVAGCGQSPEQKAAAGGKAAADRKQGFHCLNPLDGSNRSLVDQVKRQLRDPNSFEHDETRIGPITGATEGRHPVSMRYRARNGFGGMNVQAAVGLVDPKSCEAELVSASASG